MKISTSDEEITNVVRRFENCEFGRSEWRHADHLIVALYYVVHHDHETARAKMRGGILKLLAGFGINLAEEMPYHETLTVFWLKTIGDFVEQRKDKPLLDSANKLTETFAKNYPLRFYSRERLFSDEARKTYLPPDLKAENNVAGF